MFNAYLKKIVINKNRLFKDNMVLEYYSNHFLKISSVWDWFFKT